MDFIKFAISHVVTICIIVGLGMIIFNLIILVQIKR